MISYAKSYKKNSARKARKPTKIIIIYDIIKKKYDILYDIITFGQYQRSANMLNIDIIHDITAMISCMISQI
jgi:hypothetical protein